MFDRARYVWISLLAAMASQACGSNAGTESGGGETGSKTQSEATVSNADCTKGCTTKATECGAPATEAASECKRVCAKSITSAQLSCLKNAPCSSFSEGSLSNVCENANGSATSGSSTTGGTTSGTGGMSTTGSSTTGGGTGVTQPATLSISGTLKDSEVPTVASSYWIFNFDIKSVTLSPSLAPGSGLPDLSKGTVTVKGVPAGCDPALKPRLGALIQGYSLIGQALGAVDGPCQSFFEGLKTGGLEVSVADAPYASGGGTCNATIVLTR